MDKYSKLLAKIIEKKLNGRKQQWLVHQADVSASVISRLMKGERLPSIENLVKIADALGASTDELLDPVFHRDDKTKSIDESKPNSFSREILMQLKEFAASISGTATSMEELREKLELELFKRTAEKLSDDEWEIIWALRKRGAVALNFVGLTLTGKAKYEKGLMEDGSPEEVEALVHEQQQRALSLVK